MRPFLLAALALAALASAPSARAEEAAPPPATDHRQSMWRLELGYRASILPDDGYNPFSDNDRLSQVSLVATRTLFTRGRFSFAPGLAYESGSSTSTARGDVTSLGVHRLAVPLDGRVHFGPWGYAFVRLAPAAVLVDAKVEDLSAPGPLQKSTWVFATDVSGGYAWLAYPWDEPEKHRVRLWLQADAGYGFAVRDRLTLAPDLSGSDVTRASPLDLGSLVLRGPFVRFAAALSF